MHCSVHFPPKTHSGFTPSIALLYLCCCFKDVVRREQLNSTSFFAALAVSMVQLSQSPLRRPSPSCHSEEGEEKSMKPDKQQVTQGPRGDNQPPMSPLQAALNSAATASQAYETYIDNGLICLKHKIRNIEKKKVGIFSKLERKK